MANSILIDWCNQDINIVPSASVYLEAEDKTERVFLTDSQFEDLFNERREYLGELTVQELEDRILDLENNIEELKGKLSEGCPFKVVFKCQRDGLSCIDACLKKQYGNNLLQSKK